MKRFTLLLLVMAIFGATPLTAQKKSKRGNSNPKCETRFDLNTIETVRGNIKEIQQISTRNNMALGTHLIMDYQGEELSIHMGPSWYLKKAAIDFEKGDNIEVTGSRILFEGKPALIAASFTMEGNAIVLRDEKGLPKLSEQCKNRMGGGNCKYKS